jgi:hypothetical protein
MGNKPDKPSQASAASARFAACIILWGAALPISPLWAGDSEPRQSSDGTGGTKAGTWASGHRDISLGGRGSVPRLVTVREVGKELGLNAEQQEAVKTIVGRLRGVERRIMTETDQANRQLPAPERERRWAETDGAIARERQQARQQIVGLLTPAQAKRLEQISLQDAGADALFELEVIRTLGLSHEQQQRLAEIREEAEEEVVARMLGVPVKGTANPPPGGASPQSLKEVIRRSDRRMLEEVLTASQRAKLKELQGAPFAFPATYQRPMALAGGGSGARPGGPVSGHETLRLRYHYGGELGDGTITGEGFSGGFGGGFGGGARIPLGGLGSVPRLVALPEVQKELGLSAEQKDAIKSINGPLRAFEKEKWSSVDRWRRGQHKRREAPPHAEAEKAIARARQQARQKILGLLTPAQAKRLEQIRLQDYHERVFFQPDVVQALGISRGQQTRLAEIYDKARKEEIAAVRERMAAPPKSVTDHPPPDIREIMHNAEQRMREEVLTAEQQAKLDELKGAPYKPWWSVGAEPAPE